MKIFLLLFFSLVIGGNIYSQDSSMILKKDRKNHLRLGVGKFYLFNLDQQASPLIYHAKSSAVTVEYFHRSQKARFSLELSVAVGHNIPKRFGVRDFVADDGKYEYSLNSEFYGLNLNSDYERKWDIFNNNKWELYVGSGLRELFFLSPDVASFYWANSMLSIPANATLLHQFSQRHSVSMQLSLPVFSVVTRSVYANFAKSADQGNFKSFFFQGSHLTGFWKYQELMLTGQYYYKLSDRFSLSVLYRFMWFQYPDPRPIRAYSQQISLSSSFKF